MIGPGRAGRLPAMSSTIASDPNTLAVRLATADDRGELDRLAALDDVRRPIARPALIAEVGGRPYAAMSIREGTVAADPFERTAEIVEILKVRSAQIPGDDERARPIRPRSRLHRIAEPSRLARPARAPRPVPAR